MTLLDGQGTALRVSSYLGGTGTDVGLGIAVDGERDVYIAGYTASGDFPTTTALRASTIKSSDLFAAKLSLTLASTTKVTRYDYDGLQRLIGALEQPGTPYTYTYDLVGNRTGAWANGVAQGQWQYGAGDQVVGWQYDAAGNLTDDGRQQYRYDALNRLTGVTTNGAGYPQTTMQYNGDGVLVAQMQHGSLTRFTQDLVAPLSQVLQTSNGNTNTTYVYGLDRLASIRSGSWTWSVADALGSTRLTLDDAGRPQTTSSFDAWGQPTTGILPTPFGFTGEWQDTSTGLVNLRARWYQPQTGRFLGRDPFPGFSARPYSLHPYQYAYSNPVLHTDPTGQCAMEEGRFACTPSFLQHLLATLDNYGAWRNGPASDQFAMYAVFDHYPDEARTYDAQRDPEFARLIERRYPFLGDPYELAVSVNFALFLWRSDKGQPISLGEVASAAAPLVGVGGNAGFDDSCYLGPDGMGGGGNNRTPWLNRPRNARGQLYPAITDVRTGTQIPFPQGQLYKVDKGFRQQWGPKEKGKYIAEWYRRGYPTPPGGWKPYDIHHIRPREFGGTNEFDNLVPVDRNLHKEFNRFWENYP